MHIFYNTSQGRLRAGWRALLVAILFLIPALLAGQIVAPILSGLWGIHGLVALPIVNGILLLAWLLFTCWLAARFFDRRPFPDFGLHFSRAWWRDAVFGFALGAVLMLAIFLVERAAGWITVRGVLLDPGRGISLAGALVSGAIGYVCVGIYEELFMRGYQIRNLAEGLHSGRITPRAALLLAYVASSLIFGVLHLGQDNAGPLTVVYLALTGMFLGLGYVLTGELALSIGLHIAWNFFQGYVFGFPVSGTGHVAAFISIRQAGPAAWTGGAWGPEGGLIGLLALLVGTLALVAWVRLTRGAVRPHDRLAVYAAHPVAAAGARSQPAVARPDRDQLVLGK